MDKILIIVDKPGWAHDHKTHNLQRTLSDKYLFIKKYQEDVVDSDLDDADLIQVYYWMQISRLERLESAFRRNLHKLLLGICSHMEIDRYGFEKGLYWLRNARAIFTVNKILFDEISPKIKTPVFYTPNGVDTEFFKPVSSLPRGEILRAGWAGSLNNQGADHRGFDLIASAVQSAQGCTLVTAIREERWRSYAEMPAYYHSLDVYICASDNEGTPNPCLEAAACGIPIITTNVGNMPELIRHGFNGYFVQRNIEDLTKTLNLIQGNEPHRLQLGKNARASIEAWDWRLQSNDYHKMYQFALSSHGIFFHAWKSLTQRFVKS